MGSSYLCENLCCLLPSAPSPPDNHSQVTLTWLLFHCNELLPFYCQETQRLSSNHVTLGKNAARKTDRGFSKCFSCYFQNHITRVRIQKSYNPTSAEVCFPGIESVTCWITHLGVAELGFNPETNSKVTHKNTAAKVSFLLTSTRYTWLKTYQGLSGGGGARL